MWNVQGCGSRNFVRVTCQYLRDHSPDIIGFVETRISGSTADRVIDALNFPYSFRVEAVGFSGGIWLCWHDHIDVEILFSHFQFVHCRISCKFSHRSTLATFIYASPNVSKRKHLWSYISQFSHYITKPWVILGDFNATVAPDERMGCSIAPDRDFINMIFDSGLHDLGYLGPDFTWTRTNRAVRLDRCLCNEYLLESFPDTIVHHLLRMKSDHRPLLLQFGHAPPRVTNYRFRYFAGWLQHTDFKRFVNDNWDSSLPISDTIANFCLAANSWNRTVFDSLSSRKRHVMARLRGCQRSLGSKFNPFLSQLEKSLLSELEKILDQEELLWKQKSRSDWISFGDRNTAYFHKRATINKRINRISKLQLANGEWCEDPVTPE
ncbi:hypothetical protein V6N13_069280 [Hibiscus sabdariffa]